LQVTPNLYGNLVANTAAGIAGGTGVMPGGKPVYILKIPEHIFLYVAFCSIKLGVRLPTNHVKLIFFPVCLRERERERERGERERAYLHQIKIGEESSNSQFISFWCIVGSINRFIRYIKM